MILPARNRRDWDDIPPSARDGLRFVWLETVGDALAATLALDDQRSGCAARRTDATAAA